MRPSTPSPALSPPAAAPDFLLASSSSSSDSVSASGAPLTSQTDPGKHGGEGHQRCRKAVLSRHSPTPLFS